MDVCTCCACLHARICCCTRGYTGYTAHYLPPIITTFPISFRFWENPRPLMCIRVPPASEPLEGSTLVMTTCPLVRPSQKHTPAINHTARFRIIFACTVRILKESPTVQDCMYGPRCSMCGTSGPPFGLISIVLPYANPKTAPSAHPKQIRNLGESCRGMRFFGKIRRLR
jgi:hypothetical protein